MSTDQHHPPSFETLISELSSELESIVRRFAGRIAEEREAALWAVRAEAAESQRELDASMDQRIADAVQSARAEVEASARAAADAAEASVMDRVDAAVAAATGVHDATLTAALGEAQAQAREAAALRTEAQSVRIGEREAALAGIERLLRGIEAIDRAATLPEVLDALAEGVAAEAERAMMFVVRGRALTAWRLRGFGETVPADASLSLPIETAGVLAQVVERNEVRQVHPERFARETAALAFAGLPASEVGLAVPVVVGGRTAAVVYADDGDAPGKPVPGGWPEAVQMLARHAGRCLEVLTATRLMSALHGPAETDPRSGPALDHTNEEAGPGTFATGPEAMESARRYARLLISELKLYNEAEIGIGRHKRDLRSRLHAEIVRARRMFEERIPAQFAARDQVFEEEIVRTLADGDPALLGVEPQERS
jgi:hypothetical protein